MNEQNNAMSDIQLSDFPAFSEQAVILVVDDQPINIQVIYQILGGSYKILMATSGARQLKSAPTVCQIWC